MAKKTKTKIEKETRKLIESISDLVKKKGDRYKFKTKKKKEVRKLKTSCVHWIIRKGKPIPAVHESEPGMWECDICHAKFPVKPRSKEEYEENVRKVLEDVNQIQFFAVLMGGDASDTKLFIQLKSLLRKLPKVERNIIKAANKKAEWDDRRKKTDTMDAFSSYSGYSYNS